MKVCIICYGFRENNIRLQPWRYISEIAIGLIKSGVDATIITDGVSNKYIINGIPVIFFDNIRFLPFIQNTALTNLIGIEKPDVILWSIGPIDYLYKSTLNKIKIPIIGLITGPIYSVSDITRLGINELRKNYRSLIVQMLYVALPKFFTRRLMNDNVIAKVIVMSRKNMYMLDQMGVNKNKIYHAPVGIYKYDLIVPTDYSSIQNKYYLKDGHFNVLYFGSPNTIRGIDTIINAIKLLKQRIPEIQLLILSRRHDNEQCREELAIQNTIKRLGIEDNVKIITGFLDKDEIKKFICYSDIITLPFKIVPSDVPTSILESMAMNKSIISTDVDGIPELIAGRGFIIQPCDVVDLSNKIFFYYKNKSYLQEMNMAAGAYMLTYPRWDEVTNLIMDIINETIINSNNTIVK